MKAQEIFDTIVAHLRKQGGKAMEGINCVYLASDGRKCAIGCLIPDGHPAQDSRGGVTSMLAGFPDLYKRFNAHIHILQHMQFCHDGIAPEHWEKEFKSIAENYNLILQDAGL